MADTVDTLLEFAGKKRRVYRFTNRSDGTGETDALKIDKSTLVNTDGVEPLGLTIEEIQWSIQGFTSVQIEWDRTGTDDEAAILAQGNGARIMWPETQGLKDPGGTGTGDVLFTTFGAISGATYDIRVAVRLVGNV